MRITPDGRDGELRSGSRHHPGQRERLRGARSVQPPRPSHSAPPRRDVWPRSACPARYRQPRGLRGRSIERPRGLKGRPHLPSQIELKPDDVAYSLEVILPKDPQGGWAVRGRSDVGGNQSSPERDLTDAGYRSNASAGGTQYSVIHTTDLFRFKNNKR
jgi:hypothetical protein